MNDAPSLSTPDQAQEQEPSPQGKRPPRRRLIWLLAGPLLFILLGLVAIAVLDALVKSPILARATPTPALRVGTEVRLVAAEYGPVTVWQVAGNCQTGLAFGQVSSGTEGRIVEGFCYNRRQKSSFHLVDLGAGSGGWVAEGELISAAAYVPPTSTATPVPTPGPTEPPTATAPPTPTPVPAPLPPGSTLPVGNWELRVDRVELTSAVDSTAGNESVQAGGRFALMYLAVTNTGFQPAALHASRVIIQDAAGTEYRNNDLASAYASSPGCVDFVLDLGSGASTCLLAAIDVPVQGGTYALGLEGETEWVLVELP